MKRGHSTDTGDIVTRDPVTIDGVQYARLLVRMPMIHPGAPLMELVRTHVKPHARRGDVLFISEKVVAISQGRLMKGSDIKVRPLALWVAGKVRVSSHGMGHRNPVVMEMAMREVGPARILFAAAAGGFTRLLGRSGDFYRLAGRRVAAIDGTNPVTIPPYGEYVVLMPRNPRRVAEELSRILGVASAVVDANDVGVELLGWSRDVPKDLLRRALGDNPMGQGHEQTPIGLLRRM